MGVEDDGVGVGVGVGVPEEMIGGPHSSVDSRFLATYKDNRSGPPQISVLFPVHGVEHCPASVVGSVPFPNTTPQ